MKSGPSDTTRRRGGAHTLPGSNEKSKDSSDGSDPNTPLIHQKTVTWQNLLALLCSDRNDQIMQAVQREFAFPDNSKWYKDFENGWTDFATKSGLGSGIPRSA
jgi:hypothetical protein